MLRISALKALKTPAMTLAAALVFTAGLAAAPRQQTHSQTSPDNSRMNQGDRQSGAPTADQQPENAADRDMAAKIRSSVMDDKSLSTYAHNVKIIARDGKVTLRGPVRSAEEKKVIVDKAGEIAGADNVTDELQVAPPKKSGS